MSYVGCQSVSGYSRHTPINALRSCPLPVIFDYRMQKRAIHSVLIYLLLISGCTRHAGEAQHSITGAVSYSTPVRFSENARLELILTDVSVEGPALQVARSSLDHLPELPYRFSLYYPVKKINPAHRYTIEARVYSGQHLSYATDTPHEVLTQGKPHELNLQVSAADNINSSTVSAPAANDETIFQGEMRTAIDVILYRIGLKNELLVWLEEERSNNTPQPVKARYEFKGALLQHYRDAAGLDIQFDERGRPQRIQRQQQILDIKQETDILYAIRNRASLLRSQALASRESQSHRKATEQLQGVDGLTKYK